MYNKFQVIVDYIKSIYPDENPVPLHAPRFIGNEKKYLNDCIDTTYVSYVGKFVSKFEEQIQDFTGAKKCCCNGKWYFCIGVGFICFRCVSGR